MNKLAKTLIVNGRLKELCKTEDGKNLNMAGDLAEALTTKTEQLIKEACKRAVANGRTTVLSRDL